MKKSDEGSASIDDAKVDEILREFFARELPPEFANAASDVVTSRAASDVKRSASWTMPALAALTLSLAACVFWIAGTRRPAAGPDALSPIDLGTEWGASVPTPAGPIGAAVPYSFSQNVRPVEALRYDTLHGVVEQRTNLNTTNVTFIEPETGDLLELTLPELVIEVFPIDDSRPAEPTGTSGENPSSSVKLPEEG
jgi:hypothetical protein